MLKFHTKCIKEDVYGGIMRENIIFSHPIII
jgi:hypothetical protein